MKFWTLCAVALVAAAAEATDDRYVLTLNGAKPDGAALTLTLDYAKGAALTKDSIRLTQSGPSQRRVPWAQ